MGALTIRNLDDDVKRRLRVMAASKGWSMEEEARRILRSATERPEPPADLGTFIHELFAKHGGVELEIPAREPLRDPPAFD